MIYMNVLLLLVRDFNWGFKNIINEILYIIPTIFAYQHLALINDLLKCAGLYNHDNYWTILLLNIKKKNFTVLLKIHIFYFYWPHSHVLYLCHFTHTPKALVGFLVVNFRIIYFSLKREPLCFVYSFKNKSRNA